MQKITRCLWFDGEAADAADFYLSVFKNSNIVSVMHYGEAGPGPKGSVLSVTFAIEGQEFIALNGGPHLEYLTILVMMCVARGWGDVRSGAAGDAGRIVKAPRP